MPALRIRVEGITERETRLLAEESLENYPVLLALSKARESEFIAPIKIEITAFREYDHIRVNGQVETEVRLTCSRCLVEYETALSSSFTLFYNKGSAVPLDVELELAGDELDSASYDGDYIDFTAEITEHVLMEIPLKPLCKEDCLGLCSNCGADLNFDDCSCNRNGTGLKFSALRNFKVIK